MKKLMTITVFCIYLVNCSGTMTGPPKTDISVYPRVGISTFKLINVRGMLDEIATERLFFHLKEYYPGTRFVHLDAMPEISGEEQEPADPGEAVRRIAVENDLSALMTGEITVSDFRPKFKSRELIDGARVTAHFRMTAVLKLFNGRSGEQIWEKSCSREGNASYGPLTKKTHFDFYISDKDESYVRFVRNLIWSLTEDLRPSKK